MQTDWILNTSNQDKMREFKRLFAKYKVSLGALHADLKEIDADPLTVVVHKASQLEEGILVEDTSLDVEGAFLGVNIRWLLEHLHQCVGRKAEWRTLLAHQKNGLIYVYEGKVTGTIVQPRGEGGFGFDPFFLPDNAHCTLAESKPDDVNARAKAVAALIQDSYLAILPPIADWDGPWQHH
jgi:XTP/dITP diphosphohydrolase